MNTLILAMLNDPHSSALQNLLAAMLVGAGVVAVNALSRRKKKPAESAAKVGGGSE